MAKQLSSIGSVHRLLHLSGSSDPAEKMRILRKMKFILAAGGAAGVLASFLAVHAHDESILEERVQEDPALYNPLKARSKWDANWDRSVIWIFHYCFHL